VVPGECGCVGAAEGAGEGVWPFAAGVPGEDRFCQAVKNSWLEMRRALNGRIRI